MRWLAIVGVLFFYAGAACATPPVEIEAPGPQGALRGTFLAADVPHAPVVLIIPGSGPTDRDGNSPLGISAAPYRLLAEALAERGVSSIRIDKRGMFGSAGAIPDANTVTIPDYVQDIASWVRAARERTGAPCIWVLGHSEGGLIALAAAQHGEGICGLLLVSAAGRRLSDVLREQIGASPGYAPLLPQANTIMAELEAGRRVEQSAIPPALAPLFAPQVQNYLISNFTYDPADLARNYRGRMLVVQGGRDLQVSEADARRLAAAHPGARLQIFPEMNHVLKRIEADDVQLNVSAYSNPDLPLAPGVADAIAAFVKEPR